MSEAQTIGVGMLGYAFMGKAHSEALLRLPHLASPPPLVPELVAIAGAGSVAPHGATFGDGYRCAEICDALVRSSESGKREEIVYEGIAA